MGGRYVEEVQSAKARASLAALAATGNQPFDKLRMSGK